MLPLGRDGGTNGVLQVTVNLTYFQDGVDVTQGFQCCFFGGFFFTPHPSTPTHTISYYTHSAEVLVGPSFISFAFPERSSTFTTEISIKDSAFLLVDAEFSVEILHVSLVSGIFVIFTTI